MRIVKSIDEITQIFKELAVAGIDEGNIYDVLDFNVESDVITIGCPGRPRSPRNSLPTRCITLLIILIAIFLVVIIVKKSPKSSD